MKHAVPVEALTSRKNLRYLPSLRGIARRNRNNSTRTEEILWYEILNNRKLGHKFVRQRPIGRFVADFYCSELLMIVEVDGGSHLVKKLYDLERDKYFEILKIITVRIKAGDLLEDVHRIRRDLITIVADREKLLKSSPL